MLTEKEIAIIKYLQDPSSMTTEKSLQLQREMNLDSILESLYKKGYIERISKPDGNTLDPLIHQSLLPKAYDV